MQFRELLDLGDQRLQQAGVAEAELDARILLQAATGKSRTEIYLQANDQVANKDYAAYLSLLERRILREPVAYILGEQEFWSLPFVVSSDVLIPRPETEFLLDRVLTLTDKENFEKGAILDLCCGSGVIAVVLARETGQTIFATDISRKALDVTLLNASKHSVGGKVVGIQGDLLGSFGGKAHRRFSLIVSNPPYVSSGDIKDYLEPEVSGFEPHLALDGGEKGLDLIIKIVTSLTDVLLPGGQLFMEIGADQGEAIRSLFSDIPNSRKKFTGLRVLKDYAGRDRVLCVKRI